MRKKESEDLETMVEKSVREPKILTIDIETSPMIAYSWGPKWETNLLEYVEHSKIMSYSAKWLDGKQTTKAVSDYKSYCAGKLDDKDIVKDIHKLLDEADIIIGHNSNRFDLRKINTRFLAHGLPPPSPYKRIDTYREAKKYLEQPSYKLDDLSQYYGIGGKIKHEGFGLWLKCLEGDKAAWKRMKTYNAQDTRLTEELYKLIRPYMTNHPNLGSFTENSSCPKCGGVDLQRRGYAKTVTSVFQRFQCNGCGGWGRYSIREHGYKTNRNE